MSTSLSLMTTEQLIDACARQDVRVSTTQLGRWVRAGLIPASLRKRHGRGRGLGTEWHWEAECLSRVILIAQTLAAGDPSFQRAAYILAASGYIPSAEYSRQVLLDRLAVYERFLTKRQPYLTDDRPVAEKQKRLTRNMRRKVSAMPDSVFQPFTTFIGALLGVISLDDPNVSDEMKQLQQFFSIPALQQRLETIDESMLLGKYEEAASMLSSFVQVMLIGTNLFVLPLLRQQLQSGGRDTSGIPTSIDPRMILESIWLEAGHILVTSNQMVGELRLILTIFLTAVPTENTLLLAEWSRTLLDIVVRLFNHFGISPGPLVSLFESTGASSMQSDTRLNS